MAKQTALEALFGEQVKQAGLPEPVLELRFHDTRQWRFDYAWPALMLAVELEGGTRHKSRHTSGQGFDDDCIKYNTAALMGWTVLRFTSRMVNDNTALEMTRQAIGARL